jgi:hypothetical protein
MSFLFVQSAQIQNTHATVLEAHGDIRCGTEELNKNKYTAVLKAYGETHYDTEGEMEQRVVAVLGGKEKCVVA